MATWQEFSDEQPDLAAAVRARFEAAKHHVLATLRRDGSPRVSGTEVQFQGGDLTIGSMYGAVKARDLQRDARFALHANPGDGSMEGGDAKVSGRAVEVLDPEDLARYVEQEQVSPPFHLFRLTLSEVVLTSVPAGADYLAIEMWRPEEPLRRFRRPPEEESHAP